MQPLKCNIPTEVSLFKPYTDTKAQTTTYWYTLLIHKKLTFQSSDPHCQTSATAYKVALKQLAAYPFHHQIPSEAIPTGCQDQHLPWWQATPMWEQSDQKIYTKKL